MNESAVFDHTNIYRTADGTPSCFCCLRVGHVAKYCRDRKYSCQSYCYLSDNHKEESSINRHPVVTAFKVQPNENDDVYEDVQEKMDTLQIELKWKR